MEALAKGMSGLNERDDHGMTPIHLAAMHGNRYGSYEILRIFHLELNVPLLAKDETYGSFPVMHFQSSGFFMSLATGSHDM